MGNGQVGIIHVVLESYIYNFVLFERNFSIGTEPGLKFRPDLFLKRQLILASIVSLSSNLSFK